MTFFETQTLEVAVLDGLLQISGAQSRESRERAVLNGLLRISGEMFAVAMLDGLLRISGEMPKDQEPSCRGA